MAFNLLDGLDYVQQQGNTGRARYADKLLGQAVIAPPEQRQSALAKLAGTDGRLAMVAENQFVQRDEDRQRRQADILTRRAKVAASMPPEALPQLWPSLRASIAQEDPELGAQLPEAWDESFRGVIQQFAGVEKQGNLTPSVSSVEDAYRRGIISKDEYDKGMRIALDLAPGASAPRITWVDKYDPATGTTYKVPMQSSGVDYTGGAPSLTYGSQPPPGQPTPTAAPQPAGTQTADIPQTPLLDTFSQQFPGFRATSTFRDPERNAKAGGLENSFHLTGNAIDGYPSSPQELAQIEQWAGQNGMEVIKYPGGRIHVEPRPGMNPASNFSPPRDPNANSPYLRTNINNVGGGAIQSGPSNADVVAQKQREAAASARGAIEGKREMGPDFGDETTLRKEFDDRTKEERTILSAYTRVADAAKNDSAAGDLSLIFAYMKMLDPNSVVRETEFANAQNAAGVPDQIRNAWNRAMTGERLGAPQRADFVRQAQSLSQQAQARIDDLAARYRRMAPDYNMSPDRIAPAPPVADAGIDDLVNRWAD